MMILKNSKKKSFLKNLKMTQIRIKNLKNKILLHSSQN